MNLTRDELEQFAADLARAPDRWQHLDSYTSNDRTYEQIWDGEDVNAWVIWWSEDHDTGFHDHDDSAAAIRVLEGHVREDRLKLNGPPDMRVIGPGTTFFVPPTAIHRVLHTGAAPAVTVHAYSPPLRRIGSYRIGPGGEVQRASQSYEQELRAEPAFS